MSEELEKVTARLRAIEAYYEDWQPVSDRPHMQLLWQDALFAFVNGTEPDTMLLGTWDQRPDDATHWCLVKHPRYPRGDQLWPATVPTKSTPSSQSETPD